MSSEANLSSVLWSQFKTGDVTAFGQLFEHYYGTLLNYGIKYSKDREFVRDCLQELFIDLWKHRQQLSETSCVKAYLMTALRNRILKELRRRNPFELMDDLFDTTSLEPSIESQLIDNEHQAEQIGRLQRGIQKLTKRQQEIIYLRFFQHHSYEEIAQIMQLGQPSVANLLYRSLRDLKRILVNGTVAMSLIISIYWYR